MPKSKESKSSEGAAERASRFFRDLNVIGAVALAGAAIVLPPLAATAAGVWAGVNAAQAGGFEVARRHFAKKRKTNS
jgi:hypothetical protein